MSRRPRRSVLYVPASNPRALEKVRELDADAFIFDLEDAVAPSAKEAARENARRALAAGGGGGRERIVRVNGMDTPWFAADLEMAAAAGADAVLAPKIEGPEDIAALEEAMAAAGMADAALWAMMETPLAMLNARDIGLCGSDGRLEVLVMGVNDLARATGARLEAGRTAFLPWLASCVAAARAGGLDILDGVFGDFRDMEGFAAECRQGRMLGMDGKTLIHPAQIETAREAFSPSRAEAARARRIVEAFSAPENAGRGVIEVDGRMVERLHLEMARKTLAARAARGDETS